MPDLFSIFFKRWKLIVGLTVTATLLTLIVSLLKPKQYGSTATALPANSTLTDKARIFNNNIESLYPELGSVDELDRIEGIAKLDTVYFNLITAFSLISHYGIKTDIPEPIYEALIKLKKATEIRRSEHGELKIRVWDKTPAVAANLANGLLQELNHLYRQTQLRNNSMVLEKLKLSLKQKQAQIDSFRRGISSYQGVASLLSDTVVERKTTSSLSQVSNTLHEQARQLEQLIGQYELAIEAAPQPLIVVENARSSHLMVKPDLLQTGAFAFGGSFIFSILLAFFLETRKRNV
jgi:capsular polysaccharide biosynthesis protein